MRDSVDAYKGDHASLGEHKSAIICVYVCKHTMFMSQMWECVSMYVDIYALGRYIFVHKCIDKCVTVCVYLFAHVSIKCMQSVCVCIFIYRTISVCASMYLCMTAHMCPYIYVFIC